MSGDDDGVSQDGRPDATSRLGELVSEAGAAAWGVTDSQPFGDVAEELRERKRTGSHAGLTFTFTDPSTATDVRRSLPWVRSLFVVAWSYVPDAGGPGEPTPGSGRVARFATRDHYEGLRRCLDVVAEALHTRGFMAEVLSDDNRLVDRAAAVRAGVGWWGKSAMVLTPREGPWLLLGSVVTDADLRTTQPMMRDCGTCDACRPACPTGAIVAPGVVDARLCLARWLQAKGSFPRELRRTVGDRVYGCDDCLEACPPGSQLLANVVEVAGRVDLCALLGRSDTELLTEYAHFYLPKRNPNVLRRNALIALGNTGGPDAVGVLAGYAGHPDPMLREHAVWALGAIGDPAARSVIESAAGVERDDRVLAEIELALA